MWRRGRVALQPPEKVMKIHIWVAPNSTGGVLGKPAGRPRASSVELYPCGFQSHLCACAIARGGREPVGRLNWLAMSTHCPCNTKFGREINSLGIGAGVAVGTVRPTVTYIFIFELVAINAAIAWYAFNQPGLIKDVDSLIRVTAVIFSDDEMAMLGGILGFWFGSRSWNKK